MGCLFDSRILLAPPYRAKDLGVVIELGQSLAANSLFKWSPVAITLKFYQAMCIPTMGLENITMGCSNLVQGSDRGRFLGITG